MLCTFSLLIFELDAKNWTLVTELEAKAAYRYFILLKVEIVQFINDYNFYAC